MHQYLYIYSLSGKTDGKTCDKIIIIFPLLVDAHRRRIFFFYFFNRKNMHKNCMHIAWPSPLSDVPRPPHKPPCRNTAKHRTEQHTGRVSEREIESERARETRSRGITRKKKTTTRARNAMINKKQQNSQFEENHINRRQKKQYLTIKKTDEEYSSVDEEGKKRVIRWWHWMFVCLASIVMWWSPHTISHNNIKFNFHLYFD